MLSIIIPAKNEENYLPKLLNSLHDQTFQDFEIIVADANSSDKTCTIARKFGAKVVKGGMPAVGRNRGAGAARGDILLFLDADVVLPNTFLKRNYALFKRKRLDCATTSVRPLSRRFDDRVIHAAWNISYRALERVYPIAAGFHIFVTRDMFDTVGGFDESAPYGEDFDFVNGVVKADGSFGVLSEPVFVSVRRFEKDGRMGVCKQGVLTLLQLFFSGPVRKKIFSYEFGHE